MRPRFQCAIRPGDLGAIPLLKERGVRSIIEAGLSLAVKRSVS